MQEKIYSHIPYVNYANEIERREDESSDAWVRVPANSNTHVRNGRPTFEYRNEVIVPRKLEFFSFSHSFVTYQGVIFKSFCDEMQGIALDRSEINLLIGFASFGLSLRD